MPRSQVLEDTGYGADKFTMVRNSDDTGSLKIVQPLDYENMNDRNGFSFTIQVRAPRRRGGGLA